MTHSETVSILETMDAIRRKWHLRYPPERLSPRPPMQEDDR
jgi:hypothetical protein